MWCENTEVAQEINNENWKNFQQILDSLKTLSFVWGRGDTFKLIASKFFKYIFLPNCGEMYIRVTTAPFQRISLAVVDAW